MPTAHCHSNRMLPSQLRRNVGARPDSDFFTSRGRHDALATRSLAHGAMRQRRSRDLVSLAFEVQRAESIGDARSARTGSSTRLPSEAMADPSSTRSMVPVGSVSSRYAGSRCYPPQAAQILAAASRFAHFVTLVFLDPARLDFVWVALKNKVARGNTHLFQNPGFCALTHGLRENPARRVAARAATKSAHTRALLVPLTE
jgi:hypothetical protein